jgi:Uma2 family endonuclease
MPDALRADYEENQHYTYADYLKWESTERYQLMYGEAFMMASPSVEHQGILMELSTQFSMFLRGKPCRVFAAPLDVRPFPKEDNSDDTVVQPDLLVVCDRAKLATGSVNGAPDLVLEIASPSNTRNDLFIKFQIYLEAGVREYWIIEPKEQQVQIHVYEAGHFISTAFKGKAVVPVSILPGLDIALETIWAAGA